MTYNLAPWWLLRDAVLRQVGGFYCDSIAKFFINLCVGCGGILRCDAHDFLRIFFAVNYK
jgi:hypothetical protein